MRTHVYTQGGKPMLAALGHVAQRGFVVCLVVWAALYFWPARAGAAAV